MPPCEFQGEREPSASTLESITKDPRLDDGKGTRLDKLHGHIYTTLAMFVKGKM
jgi:hypothetical protein